MIVQLTTNKDTFKKLPEDIRYFLVNADKVELWVTDQYSKYDITNILTEFDSYIKSGKLTILNLNK
jgi:hypothetical protein